MYFENSDYAAATALATIQAIDPTLSFSDAKEIGAACVGTPTVKNGITYAILPSNGGTVKILSQIDRGGLGPALL